MVRSVDHVDQLVEGFRGVAVAVWRALIWCLVQIGLLPCTAAQWYPARMSTTNPPDPLPVSPTPKLDALLRLLSKCDHDSFFDQANVAAGRSELEALKRVALDLQKHVAADRAACPQCQGRRSYPDSGTTCTVCHGSGKAPAAEPVPYAGGVRPGAPSPQVTQVRMAVSGHKDDGTKVWGASNIWPSVDVARYRIGAEALLGQWLTRELRRLAREGVLPS